MKIFKQTNKRVAFIASGDMSHCLQKGAPGGFSPQGEIFDKKVVEIIKNNDLKSLLKLDEALVEQSGECGLRSLCVLGGLLDEYQYTPEILSYEAPFGVGYLVANYSFK